MLRGSVAGRCAVTMKTIGVFLLLLVSASSLEVDKKGYVLYCPCMGRFGNQAEHFLGALAFAKGLNRTLVLPPWVEYHPRKKESVQVPFDTYFKVDPLQEYHRVITMEIFMEKLAPTIWPSGKRTVYCYRSRAGEEEEGCNAKSGNPFGPFWNTFNIDFDDFEFYGPLSFHIHYEDDALEWNERFPPQTHHVMAFTGAPASFPVSERNIKLHKYLVWSDKIKKDADEFVQNNIGEGPYVGIHLRNGIDFKRACEHVDADRNMFASAQCLGYGMQHGTLTPDLCYPSDDIILNQVKSVVKQIKAKAVFVAYDDKPMLDEIKKHLKTLKVKVVKRSEREPHVDLAILAMSDHYIGNCVSTFTAFATRERLTQNKKPTSFWAFSPKTREEL